MPPPKVTRRALLGAGAGALLGAGAASVGARADAAAPAPDTTPSGRTLEYWIAAVNTAWDLAPNGHDPVMDEPVTPATRRFAAITYRRYTPGWRRRWPNRASGDNGGIPGPTIRAQVGDEVLVHFKNLDRTNRWAHSMHFHAFQYGPASDGAYIPFVSGRGAAVPFGDTFTYRLFAGANSAGVWPYHDHSLHMHESIDSGLYGAIVISRPEDPPPDREFVVFFASHGSLDTINGRAFIGNTPTFQARVGELVQWDVLTLGENFHVFHVHGHRWLRHGVPVDSELLGPSSTLLVQFREDAPGTWYYHCHVESHMRNGMIGLYRVT